MKKRFKRSQHGLTVPPFFLGGNREICDLLMFFEDFDSLTISSDNHTRGRGFYLDVPLEVRIKG